MTNRGRTLLPQSGYRTFVTCWCAGNATHE